MLAKKYFNTEGNFRGQNLTGKTEVIGTIEIPRVDESISGTNFEVVVGFELTQEHLEFNRAGKRFRMDAGQ